MNLLTFHPPVWLRKITVKSNLYRLITSTLRSIGLNHKYYRKYNHAIPLTNSKTLIFMVDGRAPHGGLCDRLWGAVFSYHIFKNTTGIDNYFINFSFPFQLSTFLKPNIYNWELPHNFIKYDSRESKAIYFGECQAKPNLKRFYRNLNHINKSQIHIYTNLHWVSHFKELFNELFTPSDVLKTALHDAYIKSGLYNIKYVSVTFRFQNLFGDFEETNFKPMPDASQKELMKKCSDAIDTILKENIGCKALVTSDSITFLNYISEKESVCIVRGEIVHPDNSNPRSGDYAFLKSFIDLYMISGAKKADSVYSNEMYKETQFAKTAAILGDIEHVEIFI